MQEFLTNYMPMKFGSALTSKLNKTNKAGENYWARTFAWLGRCRRLAKDFEASIASAVAWAFVAHIRTLTRRLARA
jgi:hypothetical protein